MTIYTWQNLCRKPVACRLTCPVLTRSDWEPGMAGQGGNRELVRQRNEFHQAQSAMQGFPNDRSNDALMGHSSKALACRYPTLEL